jgi:hypothetical protein
MNWFSLIALRETLNATTRLAGILMRSRPQEGFPLVRLFIDALERVSVDSHPVTVAPAVLALLRRFEVRCPGLIDALRGDLYPHPLRDRDRLATPPEADG